MFLVVISLYPVYKIFSRYLDHKQICSLLMVNRSLYSLYVDKFNPIKKKKIAEAIYEIITSNENTTISLSQNTFDKCIGSVDYKTLFNMLCGCEIYEIGLNILTRVLHERKYRYKQLITYDEENWQTANSMAMILCGIFKKDKSIIRYLTYKEISAMNKFIKETIHYYRFGNDLKNRVKSILGEDICDLILSEEYYYS